MAHRVLVAVVGRAVVDDRDGELLARIVDLHEALDGVVDRRALVEQRHDDADGGLPAVRALLVELLALDDREVEPEHVAVQEHDEDEEVDRKG
jgi:hypothetical protein